MAPDPPPPEPLVAADTLGACGPPDALVVSALPGAPGHGGHASEPGIADAGDTPTLVLDADVPPPPPAEPVTGAPRITSAPTACAPATVGHASDASATNQIRIINL